MWNQLIKQKLYQILEQRNIDGKTISLAVGREASWFSQFRTNRRTRIDLDTDVVPILDYLGIDTKKFLAEIIYEQSQQELRQIFA